MTIELQTETDLFGVELSAGADIDRDELAHALYAVLKDVTLADFVSFFTNRFEAMISYVNLCAGEKDGQHISLLFNPHRLDTRTKISPVSVYASLKDERFVNGLARVVLVLKKRGITRNVLFNAIGMGVQGTSYLQEFPPHVARALAIEYGLSKSSSVLDPCAGWGGRMLGFSAVCDRYTACEPSRRTAAGLRELLTFIQSFRSSFHATLHELPFEDAPLTPHTFDFAMTSPPYYDTEHYAPGEKANSFNRYPTFDAWCAGFYAPLIHRTMAALKPGAAFVLNIGSRLYPLNDRLFSIAEGRYLVERQKGKLSAANGFGKTGEGETFYEVRARAECVFVSLEPPVSMQQPAEPVEGVPEPAAPAVSASGPAVSMSEPAEPAVSTQPAAHSLLEPAEAAERAGSTLEPAVTSVNLLTEPVGVAVSVASFLSTVTQDDVPIVAATLARDAERASVEQIVTAFAARGFSLASRDGRLFVTPTAGLTDDDRAQLSQRKLELVTYLAPIDAPLVAAPTAGLFDTTPAPAVSLATYLGSVPPPVVDWKAQPPPRISDLTHVILNFETNGLDWAKGDRPIGVTIGSLDGTLSRYLPFAHRGPGNLDEQAVIRYLQTELRGKFIKNANTKFDVHMARQLGVDLEAQGNIVSDIQHTAALLDDHRKVFKLDVLAKDYLGGIEVPRVDERDMASYEAHQVAQRAEYQATLVSQLHAVMYPEIEAQELTKVHDLEDRVIYPVVEMEKNGAPIDMELLEQYGAECCATRDALLWEITREVGFAFEPNASGWKRLLAHCNLAIPDSFSEDVLDEFDHPLIRKGQRASQYASLNNKVFKAYKEQIGDDGILRFSINQLRGEKGGTVTGRFSIGYVQQVPNADNHAEVFGDTLNPRRLYIPQSGVYLEADAQQIEFRIFAHHANNARMLAAYAENPEMSFHRFIHAVLQQYKEMSYTSCKQMNFMIIYAGGLIKTAVMMGYITARVGDEIAAAMAQKTDPRLSTAREIRAIYDREIPEVGPLLKMASHLAQSQCDEWCNKSSESRSLHRRFKHRGQVRTLLGRIGRFPNNYGLHKALNKVIQGSAADIMKTKLVELHEQRRETGFLLRMTVHDSVGGDIADAESAQRVKAILNHQSFPLRVPILWSVSTGANWAACK